MMGNKPENAIVLFNGKDLNGWHARNGGDAGWEVSDGVITVKKGTGDIVTDQKFTDFMLHLEWMEPDMPEATGQAKGNSGVYLQGRYEVQVLDSYGIEVPGMGDCGAIYNQHAPLVNACKPALEWQTYDMVFRGARVDDDGNVVDQARVTIMQNGQIIHNNVEMQGPTGGAMDENVGEPGPLLLQDHGNPIKYRNIWLVELPLKGSDKY
ncbi:DUF1080 domain-containing protein [Candidatus Poribacteria bacterium]|nr:DUF1080 domain-containing protein [Candidatus Poribacteria bacterium]